MKPTTFAEMKLVLLGRGAPDCLELAACEAGRRQA